MATTYTVSPTEAGATLAAFLRQRLAGQSWNQVRKLIAARHVRLDGDLCLDPARRIRPGEVIELLPRPAPRPVGAEQLHIRFVDAHLVVVEKPAGLRTVPHPAERDWPKRRKALHPSLADLVASRIRDRLRIVHRLDKETSGLLVFARTAAAERGLGQQFKKHTVLRRYLALVPGHVTAQRLVSRLVRDRGDGRRGSTQLPGLGKLAITHIEVVERLPHHTLLACRLETGRTHQIRIHLSELGHPICGEKVYHRRPDGTLLPACPGAPRLALHAAELGFTHPITGQLMHWAMALPADLSRFLERLRGHRIV
jgi:23S rRNA pseudouridine1911/1915/1917 synthase